MTRPATAADPRARSLAQTRARLAMCVGAWLVLAALSTHHVGVVLAVLVWVWGAAVVAAVALYRYEGRRR